jgi:hypothetical protein
MMQWATYRKSESSWFVSASRNTVGMVWNMPPALYNIVHPCLGYDMHGELLWSTVYGFDNRICPPGRGSTCHGNGTDGWGESVHTSILLLHTCNCCTASSSRVGCGSIV